MQQDQPPMSDALSGATPAAAGAGAGCPPATPHLHIRASGPEQGTQDATRADHSVLVRWIYTNNPFYLLSACFFLYSQTLVFNTSDPWIDTAIPFVLLLAYATLLAGTAVAIVRWGRVWDDARSILLVLLTLLLVLSVTLDTKILEDLNMSVPMLTGCWVYALCISAGVVRGLRINLPVGFRVVYSALLGLFFYYPYLLARLATFASTDAVSRAIGLFPTVAGIGYLLLIPAVRRGRDHVSENGTPWRWPLFPWTVFAVIAIAVCLRTYLLGISFYPGAGFGSYQTMDTGVSVYMLIPFLAALTVLILEHGVSADDARCRLVALLSPVVFVTMAAGSGMAKTPLELQFTRALLGPGGSPLTVAVVCSLAVTGYAWLRRVRLAPLAFVVVAVTSVALDTRSACLQSVGVAPPIVSLITAGAFAWMAFRRKTSVWGFASLACLVGGLTWQYYDTRFMMAHGAIPLHIALLGGTLVVTVFDDMLSQFVTGVIALLVPPLFFAAIFFSGNLAPGLPPGVLPAYLFVLIVLGAHGFLYLNSDYHLYAAGLCAAMVVVDMYARFHVLLEQLEVPAVPFLTGAAVSFTVALLISMSKGDMLSRMGHTAFDGLVGFRDRLHA